MMNYCLTCGSLAVMFGSGWANSDGGGGYCQREVCHECNESGRPYRLAEKPAEAHLNCKHDPRGQPPPGEEKCPAKGGE